jgi:hypothetical protein
MLLDGRPRGAGDVLSPVDEDDGKGSLDSRRDRGVTWSPLWTTVAERGGIPIGR